MRNAPQSGLRMRLTCAAGQATLISITSSWQTRRQLVLADTEERGNCTRAQSGLRRQSSAGRRAPLSTLVGLLATVIGTDYYNCYYKYNMARNGNCISIHMTVSARYYSS